MTTTAKIAAKGCQDTGITEELAKRLHDQLGKTVVAIVELSSDARTENKGGDESVKLVINTVEPATSSTLEDHLRELARGAYYERGLKDGQAALDDTLEPTVKDVIAAGDRHKPHPFLPADASQDNGICDVCGIVADGTPLHDERAAVADPFTVPDADEDEDEDMDED